MRIDRRESRLRYEKGETVKGNRGERERERNHFQTIRSSFVSRFEVLRRRGFLVLLVVVVLTLRNQGGGEGERRGEEREWRCLSHDSEPYSGQSESSRESQRSGTGGRGRGRSDSTGGGRTVKGKNA